mmetsp:Transcript_6742/g.11310  ORF Transcript_6742/g.11310 Transcript_6742/m.11310 type:complete len:119 (-) Transcript_6742:271-627(-)
MRFGRAITLAAILSTASAEQEFVIGVEEQEETANPPNSCMSDTDLIKLSEGYRACMYKDTMGIKTICYGYNLERSQAKSQITNVGGDYNSVMSGGCLTQTQCNSLIDLDVQSARSGEA